MQAVAIPSDPRFIDMTGLKFGDWKVIEFAGRGRNKKPVWRCECSCGSINVIEGSQLRRGISKSCGHAKKTANIGRRFGRLVIISRVRTSRTGNVVRYLCKCDCGNEKEQWMSSLKAGVDSCGCLTKEKLKNRLTKHGMAHTRQYKAWAAMKDRCLNNKNQAFPHYGGRGIAVCDRWMESFDNFICDMGQRPAGMTLERVDNDKGYEPGNCIWATRKSQQRNRRANVKIEYKGKIVCLSELEEITGVRAATIRARMLRGASAEEAVGVPMGLRFTISRKAQGAN